MLALPFVWLILRQFNQRSGDWSRSIDPELLKHLTPASSDNESGKKNWPPILLLLLAIIGLSGPSWEQKPRPVAQLQDDMVVILDLSVSMLATDVKPSRLVRAKQKLHDLLALRTEGNTSLIVFSGDSHIVTPLTDDINTIKASLEALDPFIMPVIGSRPDNAVNQAIELFKQNNSRSGRVILIADSSTQEQNERISDALSSK
ncbi:VWA domain-containing protein, partial [Oleiphilus sp. HI0132]|uniref:vWA domain-containing protein n=1 Tax=Oleiphilus sp. HI0132 TaxID=1822270 RepID=UPI0012E6F393